MKNSPQTSVVVTCSLYPFEDLLFKFIILLKFPDKATPSLLNMIEKTTKQIKNIENKTPLTTGVNEKDKPSIPFTVKKVS
jgi:hypothetical protein